MFYNELSIQFQLVASNDVFFQVVVVMTSNGRHERFNRVNDIRYHLNKSRRIRIYFKINQLHLDMKILYNIIKKIKGGYL